MNQVLDSCESTNDLVRKLGESGAPHGSWMSARSQTRGRGRQGREWRSEQGNLFLSYLARPPVRALWTWVPLASAVAVVKAVDELKGPRLSLKWPNDLWLGQAKAGGVLCEAVGTKTEAFIVIGLGVNAKTAPENLDQETASLGLDVDELRSRVLANVSKTLLTLDTQGPAELAAFYEERAALKAGSEIEWMTSDGKRAATVHGLGPSGELVVSTGSLYAEDVRLLRSAAR